MTEPPALSAVAGPLFVSGDAYLHPSLPTVWFGVVLFALGAYVALDGLDFGVGMVYATRTDEAERETLLAAFGPVWDANEVWLVAFGTSLLAAFPPAYARLLSEQYLLVIGLVLALLVRGVAPELREHRSDRAWRRRCDRLFVLGSTLAPLLLGTFLGRWLFASGASPLPAALTGVALPALSLTTGSAYLAAKTAEPLRADLVRYGRLATGAYLGVLSALGLTASVPALAILPPSVLLAATGLALASTGRYRAWFASALGLAALFVAVAGASVYPTIYPPSGLAVDGAVVSPIALDLLTVLALPVLLVVLGYFAYLYAVFGGQVDSAGYGG